MIGLTSMSEIPAIGRTFPYIVTLALFVVLQVPTALVNNFAGLMILRFLAGIVGSPPRECCACASHADARGAS